MADRALVTLWSHARAPPCARGGALASQRCKQAGGTPRAHGKPASLAAPLRQQPAARRPRSYPLLLVPLPPQVSIFVYLSRNCTESVNSALYTDALTFKLNGQVPTGLYTYAYAHTGRFTLPCPASCCQRCLSSTLP